MNELDQGGLRDMSKDTGARRYEQITKCSDKLASAGFATPYDVGIRVPVPDRTISHFAVGAFDCLVLSLHAGGKVFSGGVLLHEA